MKRRFYNLLLIVTLIVLFGGIFEFANAQESPQKLPPQTLISYPTIANQSIGFETPLPEIIKYIYLFAVGICGAVALAAILLGAIKYIGAAGNPSKMGDAKEQIVSAILGVIILLSSYLILYTINPDLVRLGLTLPPIDTSQFNSGTDNYKCICRCDGNYTGAAHSPEPWPWDRPLDPARLGNVTWNKWGNEECELESSYFAWQNCKKTCEATARHDNLGTGCSPDKPPQIGVPYSEGYRNSVIESCSQNPSP